MDVTELLSPGGVVVLDIVRDGSLRAKMTLMKRS